jgi:methanogenic corrinoid protein MtbC1
LATFSSDDIKSLAGIISFFGSLREIALSGSDGNVSTLLDESRRLAIPPLDLMMGILQPLLAEIGDLWASNKISVSMEHRFSSLVGNLLADSRNGNSGYAQPQPPELVLINAEDNSHTLGLQMAEVYFSTQGIPSRVYVPGLPTNEILDLLCIHHPKAVGFSLGLPAHMKQVQEVVRGFKELPIQLPKVLVGGPAVRLGLDPDPSLGLVVCNQLEDALLLLHDG